MSRLPILPLAALLLAAGPLAHADDAPHRCKYQLAAKLPIRYVGSGLQPAIVGAINGTPATLLIDTGADTTYLTMTGALKRNVNLRPTTSWIEGVGGVSRMYLTTLHDLSIGPVQARNLTVRVAYNTALAMPYDGILGASNLLGTDMELDLRAKQLRFFAPQDCERAILNIWKEDTVSVPFESTRDHSDNPHFAVLLNGKRVDAEIDTGASHSFLTLAAARGIGIDPDAKDAKGIQAVDDAYGIGSDRVRRWRAALDTVAIGDETISTQAIDVLDMRGRAAAELYLGQDFLRAHRVLFAIGQNKLYLAYLGGNPFATDADQQAMLREEAAAGNPDALYAMALANPDAPAWLDKAVAAGQPNAVLTQGQRLYQAGRYADAAAKLNAGLAQLPSDRYAPLWLYLARVRSAQAAVARDELAANMEKQKNEDWPAPVASFFLGRLDAAHVLDAAGKNRGQRCDAERLIGEWHAAHGEAARADALQAAQADCAHP